ncbi:DUF7373 family lipoprotein [Nocardia alni]|uniref:DUF7373 family lipoprotein n=1 Tax=Nocardia alni TaxID=2815723 RepID=UPI001C2332E9|nr:hypothetical protein [Nocardia alni]
MHTRLIKFVASLSSAAAVAGCGASISGIPAAGELDVTKLSAGNYPVAPIDSVQQYSHTYRDGKTLAAIRLANHTITGLDVDPRLKFGSGAMAQGAIPTSQVSDWSTILSASDSKAVEQNGAMFGFSSGSMNVQPDIHGYTSSEATLLTITIIQFPGDGEARQAASDIYTGDLNRLTAVNQPVSLPKYPDAHSYRHTGTPQLNTIIAHGHYIVKAEIQVPNGDTSAMASLAEKAYDKQLSMLDALPPLSPMAVLKQPPDPDGIIRRLLNPDQDWVYGPGSLASYDLQGFLQLQRDRAAAKQLYQSLHIDAFGVAAAYILNSPLGERNGDMQPFIAGIPLTPEGTVLYRSPDTDSARVVWSKILNAPGSAMAPQGVPDAKCTQLPSETDLKNFTCAVRYRQYVGVVWARQLDDAQQRAAAEYALLANSQGM